MKPPDPNTPNKTVYTTNVKKQDLNSIQLLNQHDNDQMHKTEPDNQISDALN